MVFLVAAEACSSVNMVNITNSLPVELASSLYSQGTEASLQAALNAIDQVPSVDRYNVKRLDIKASVYIPQAMQLFMAGKVSEGRRRYQQAVGLVSQVCDLLQSRQEYAEEKVMRHSLAQLLDARDLLDESVIDPKQLSNTELLLLRCLLLPHPTQRLVYAA